MIRWLSILVLVLAAGAAGYFLGNRGADPHGETATAPGEREILYWVAPMDPNYRRDGPGKSPMGMDLVPVYADEAGAATEGVVSIDATVSNNLGVRTAPVAYGALSRTVDTVGKVGWDEHALSQINTRVSGWIEVLGVRAVGDPVAKGQLLFELYSPELVTAQEEYLAALRGSNTRLQRASRERLVALGVDAGEIARLNRERTVSRRQKVHARRDGVVAKLHVLEGAYVMPMSNVLAIGSLARVWVVADVFERQAGWVEAGQTAQLHFDALPGQTRSATIDLVAPELDPTTRSLRIRLVLDNPEGHLRPNMFARVRIDAADTPPVRHIPREALIRGAGADRVVLALGDGRFRSQPVTAGAEVGDRIVIEAGLDDTDRVVTSAQFLIDSESNVGNALARMAPPQAEPDMVRVDAVIEGYRVAPPYITVDHAPIEAWSWPRMSMGFDVADGVLPEGLKIGDRVELRIERLSESDYIVTQILQERTP